MSEPTSRAEGRRIEDLPTSVGRRKRSSSVDADTVADPSSRPRVASSGASQVSAGDRLDSEEAVARFVANDARLRFKLFATFMLVINATALSVPLVLPDEGNAWAGYLGFGIMTVFFAGLRLYSSRAEGYSADVVGRWALLFSPLTILLMLYLGSFSVVPGIMALALYQLCMTVDRRYALTATILGGVSHAGLVVYEVAVLGESVGVVRPPSGVLATLLGAAAVQIIYVSAFIAGDVAARQTRRLAHRLKEAAVQAANREALMREARADLDRLAGLGEPGRGTDLVLGSFRLRNVIGRGAMGEIYRAEHVASGEPAAVKLLKRGAGMGSSNRLKRFAREAKIAASIDSPHVVRILEIGGSEEDIPYIAMEMLEGEDLAALLRREKRLSGAQIVELASQIALALEAARTVPVVHRDLKPQNLFRTERDGEVVWKVLDFGVSKMGVGAGSLTANHLVGTPSYMSPEQILDGTNVDHRSDIYALGVVLYRTIAGRPAFSGPDMMSIADAVTSTMPPRPSSVVNVPRDVDSALRIALAKDPAHRYQTATELAAALEAGLRDNLSPELRERAIELERRLPWRAGRRARGG